MSYELLKQNHRFRLFIKFVFIKLLSLKFPEKMRIIIIIFFLLIQKIAFCQQSEIQKIISDYPIMFSGKVTYKASNSQITIVSLIQSSNSIKSVQTDSLGRYTFTTNINFNQPFILSFTSLNYLDKTISFNLSTLDDFDLEDSIIRPIGEIDLEMTPVNPLKAMKSLEVMHFDWDNNLPVIDQDYGVIQRIKLINYENNNDSSFVQYSEDGKIIKSISIVNGLLEGKSILYFPNGNVKLDIDFKNDCVDGQLTRFHENGKIDVVKLYQKGILISSDRYIYSRTGKLLKTIKE